ncbi:MAG: 4,5-DOPA dioxygenase extradiol [Prolixibacteraceae bacterium]|nr:4,5-DOPA dioxygenase extradiol [Prolixibacteraceae bacterium]
MKRRSFLGSAFLLPVALKAMNYSEINQLMTFGENTPRMPVLFVGHGSPMNAIEENEFVEGWRNLGKSIPRPKAILCVSAHWETKGTYVTAVQKPQIIHDFGGFPKALFDVQYPAPGSPELAHETKRIITKTTVGLDEKWGLDHGAWSVIRRIYPEADVPVIEMSMDYSQGPQYHYELGKQLAALRNKGVLIIGSGNMVHNLRMVAWDKMNEPKYGFDWAIHANDKFKQLIQSGNHKELINYTALGREVQLAIPTPDHYLPLLYALALKEENEAVSFFNDKPVMGSLTMTSVKIG